MSYLHSYRGSFSEAPPTILPSLYYFISLSEGLSLPSLKVRPYYSADFSTVKPRVLMFTKEATFVHKICEKSPLRGAAGTFMLLLRRFPVYFLCQYVLHLRQALQQ